MRPQSEMPEQSAYAILNLRKGASEQEIKRAFVELVKRYDPEQHSERFMIIQNAYERLRDPVKRAKEDVFTYNFIKGEFSFLPEEKEEDPLPDVLGRIRELERQLQEDPENPAIKPALILNYMKRSYRNAQKKLWSEAIKDWQAVLKLDPTHQRAKNNLFFAYSYLAYYYALHDLTEEAINLWELALQMDPGNVELIHNLAIAYEQSGQLDKAMKYWEETVRHWKQELEKDPSNEYLRNCIIEVHKHHGGRALQSVPTPETKQEAVEQYREILKYNPNDFEARYNVAATLMEEQKFDEAIQELKNLHAQFPRNIDVVNLLGWAYLNAGQFEMAFTTWRRGLAQDPKNTSLRDSIARARLAVGKKLKEGGHYTQALVHFKELLKLQPKAWEIHYEIADTLLRKGDRRAALAEFQKVLELDPKNKLAKKAISEIRLRA